MKCPEGQVLFQGACVPKEAVAEYYKSIGTGGLSGTQGGNSGRLSDSLYPNPVGTNPAVTNPVGTNSVGITPPASNLSDLSELYGNYGGAIKQSTEASIEAARQNTQIQQQSLDKQLEQQRTDYLRSRQTLQKETFLRGRNVLANLANRGLATTGLLQLGDVQRTIATGQQMSNLSEVFNRASESLQQSKLNLGTSLQQYTSQQQADMATKLAGLDMQQRDSQIKEAERLTALVEDTISASAGGTMTPEQQNLINQIYAATASGDTGTLQGLLDQVEQTAGTGTVTGGLSGLVAPPQNQYSIVKLSNGVKEYYTLGTKSSNALLSVIEKSDNFKADSEFMSDLNKVPNGTKVDVTVRTRGNIKKAGLNDDYFIELNGKEHRLEGRELAILIMNGALTVEPNIAFSIVQGESVMASEEAGDKWDVVLRPYLKWLEENNINKETVTNTIR